MSVLCTRIDGSSVKDDYIGVEKSPDNLYCNRLTSS